MTGQPATQHEWLSALIFELINRLFGFEGIILLCALVIGATIYLLYKNISGENQTLLPVLLAVLLTLINSMVHWLARPHIFSFLLLIIWMIILKKMRDGHQNRWWMLPALMFVWVNLHGGFIIGFITWAIYGFGLGFDILFQRTEEKDRLAPRFWVYYLLAGITSFFASLLNPSGFDLWVKVVGHASNKYLASITDEFQSPNFHEITFWPFLLTIGLLVIVLGLSNKKFKSEILFNAASWLMLGLYSGRNIPLFAIITAPLLAEGLNDLLVNANPDVKLSIWIKGLDSRLQVLDGQLKGTFWPLFSILIVILGLAAGLKFDMNGQGYALDPEVFPIAAVDWLEDNPQEGEMFNYFTWGGYLEYRLWPEKRVFIDSKSDFFGEDFVRQYGKVILQQEGWQEVLDQYDVSWAILPTGERAVRAIEEKLGWVVIYQDNTAVIIREQ
ncbi:MAG TPA: hypothetical protein DCP10_07365 [Bacteroidales bacterium]|nr:hypothetical protein [Bacteroidales bacterium]